MLYPKNQEPFSDELFENPTSEYRAAPFWAWNSQLSEEELLWQIEQFKKMGFGGFHMHVRTGLSTPYLGDEFMSLISACVDKAKDEKMLAWLYDEDRWPSGAGGGFVTKNPDYRIRHLLLTRHPYSEYKAKSGTAISTAGGSRTGNGELLACYDIMLNANGSLNSFRRIAEDETANGIKLYAYEETALPSPWYNNQTYVDTLNPKAIAEFIRVTYDSYQKAVGKDFGTVIPAIFTDEPQFSHKETLFFADEDKDITLPWTGDLTASYKDAYEGEDLLDSLPELIWDLPGGESSRVRYHYHDHIAERFSSAFADQCGGWCGAHKLMLTGHMMEEPTLESQTAALGEAMRSYRSFQLPGIDMLCDRREYTTAKQAQSASRQFGRPGVISELYGVTNWDFDFRGHKLQGDWQAALGVTVRVPHLSWVSMNGEAKRDYPSTFNYQSPWFEQYPYIENHFARVSTAMTRGRAVCRIGVIHPIESYWLHWGPQDSTESIRRQMDERFQSLTDWLLKGSLDFDFISESLLPIQCDTGDIDAKLPVGEMKYSAVLVPPVETLRSSTLERLEKFRAAGGRLIFLGSAPALCDAQPAERGLALWEKSEKIPFDRLAILDGLSDLRDLEIRNARGEAADNLLYQLREDSDGSRWLFIAQSDKPCNQDIPAQALPEYRILLRGEYDITIYDTVSGVRHPAGSVIKDGCTELRHTLYEHDSVLLRLNPLNSQGGFVADESQRSETREDDIFSQESIIFKKPVPVSLSEPNVLLLDMPEYALDGGDFLPADEILRLDDKLRARLGWPLRGERFAQPWVENDSSTPHTLRLRYSFDSDIAIESLWLAMENAENAEVTLNGRPGGQPEGWYVDKCIKRIPVHGVKSGENVIEISFPYGKKTDVEACYLLGDFGVEVRGCSCRLTAPVRSLSFGDITRQGLPFYGGNLTYHMEAESRGGSLEIEAGSYRSHLLRVLVDEAEAGIIAYSPYKLRVDGLKPGIHKIDLICYGTRVNTFGQLHRNDRVDQWWGPASWRTTGAAWTWEYKLWEQGVLKSPEIKGN